MNNLYLTFCAFFSFLAMMHGFSRGMSPTLLASVLEAFFLISFFRFFRKNEGRVWLISTVVLCGIFFFYFAFEFSRAFNQTTKFSQIVLALSMNANLVLGAVIGIFGLSQQTTKDS